MPVTTRADDPCTRVCRADATRRYRLLGGPHRRNHTEDPRLTEHSAGSCADADNTISRFTEYLSSARLVKMAKSHSTPSARADRGPLPNSRRSPRRGHPELSLTDSKEAGILDM